MSGLLVDFLRYLKGYVTVMLGGHRPESVLTEIIKKNIKVKKIVKKDNEIIFICSYLTYKKFKKIAESKANLSYEVKKQGLPVYLNKYKKRYGLIIGIFVFLITLYSLTFFVWDIRVSGCVDTSEKGVVNLLDKKGLKIGAAKSKINATVIENSFLLERDDISWISINLKGTTAFVELREVKPPPIQKDTSFPSNIYASRDGIIKTINDYMGYRTVNVGDTVTAGDLLVTGEYTDKYGKEYKLHSDAEILAYTTHSHSVYVPFEYYQQKKTGKCKNYYKINLIRFSLPLYFNKKISYNTYSKNKSVNKLRLSDSLVLPFSVEKTSYLKTDIVKYVRSQDDALSLAYEKLYDYEYNLVGVDVLNRDYDVSKDENGVRVKVTLDCVEDIGVKIKLE